MLQHARPGLGGPCLPVPLPGRTARGLTAGKSRSWPGSGWTARARRCVPLPDNVTPAGRPASRGSRAAAP